MIVIGLAYGITATAIAAAPTDPLFDLSAIMNNPVDFEVLETEETDDGIVFQTIEYTTRIVDGEPERIQGIFAFPRGAESRPAVFWSQGGMSPASRHFPGIFARKGYACLVVTLPHSLRQSFRIPFDADDPETANLTLLARDQLRGITALSQRPEVDPERIAVAGASYGGVFATLIAGVDPRVKAGFSFFGGGYHALGSNLPQFQGMQTLEDVEIWNRTIDPAFRLEQRDIPFMWGVAFNDNWFHFPALRKTFINAAGTGKRVAILPHWQHGFPPAVDQALIDFLDTSLTRTRPPYNAPEALQIREEDGKAIASFTWTGDNPPEKAEIVVSFGQDTPWLGWSHRASFVFPARIEGRRASARLPIPSRKLPLIVWGSLTDANDVLTSTTPVTLSTADLSALPTDPELELNCFPDGTLGDGVLDFYRRHNQPLLGQPDDEIHHSGKQSLRVEAPEDESADPPGFAIRHLHNVPGVAHRFAVQLRAERPTQITVRLTPVRPRAWRSEVVRQLVAQDVRLAPLLSRWDDEPEPMETTATIGPTWEEVAVEIPEPTAPIEGYTLEIRPAADEPATYWIDSIRMQPIWPE